MLDCPCKSKKILTSLVIDCGCEPLVAHTIQEQNTFVFSDAGGQGKAATAFYKRLGLVISEKKNEPNSITMALIRYRLGLILLRSAIMCLRGHRSRSRVGVAQPSSTKLVAAECNLLL